ncbi:hypothetical protein CHS0354_025157 [Potamilus streckersoni]|uniref:Thyroglobulin type-1 domain-containing protein n=1 Tax=Potamilus streckersoni TaxID=2493646 RepID=A0AAE0RW85_9BIVA|nr:hypothetical protein CHS0354_025157 [Potamilus streckersoni]
MFRRHGLLKYQPESIVSTFAKSLTRKEQMLHLVFFAAASFAVGNAIVCTTELCQLMGVQTEIHCKGSIIRGGGFCGCSDACAKVEGEICQHGPSFFRGMPPAGTCDTGLVCNRPDPGTDGANTLRLDLGVCVRDETSTDKTARAVSPARSLCQQMRIHTLISMVVYRGQWTPLCDADGLFMPMQCDNTNHCFCVDVHTGKVDESTKVLGEAVCITTTTVTPILP